jgi:hypothetical protein
MSDKKQVAKKTPAEITKENVMAVFDGVEVSGFEDTCKDTYKTPFVRVLQDLSDEVKPKKDAYIAGATAGMLCNKASKKLYDSINIVVLKIEHNIIAWKPNRGGFVGAYPKSMENQLVKSIDGYTKIDKDGNELSDTISLFCLNADDPTDIFVLPMSGASLKHARSFVTRMKMLQCNGKSVDRSYAGVWNISSVEETNDKGSWYTIGNTPKFEKFVDNVLFNNYVKPSIEMLKSAETDYSSLAETSPEDESQY